MEYVVYEEGRWGEPCHFETVVGGTEKECLEAYMFFRDSFPHLSLGFATKDEYRKIKELMKEGIKDDAARQAGEKTSDGTLTEKIDKLAESIDRLVELIMKRYEDD